MDATELVVRYLETTLPPPDIDWGRREFEQRLYERWTAENLLDLLMNSNRDPVDIAEGYLLSLIAATKTCVDNKNLIFASAIHTAEAILNLLEKEYSV